VSDGVLVDPEVMAADDPVQLELLAGQGRSTSRQHVT
jgi:hypothetical protein